MPVQQWEANLYFSFYIKFSFCKYTIDQAGVSLSYYKTICMAGNLKMRI